MAEAKKLREIARFKTNNPEWLGIVNDKLEDLPHLNTFQQLDPLYNELFEGTCPPVTAATRNVIKNKIRRRLVELRGGVQPINVNNGNRMNVNNGNRMNVNNIGRSAKSKRSKSKRSKSKRSKSKRSKSKRSKSKKKKGKKT